ncbi:MAG: chromosome partitioning protein ParA [Cupriavidus sp.]|nr:chromosome partitioning protein ParA [Cupriavidus sp.]
MLKEIRCSEFKHPAIVFHAGLNIILGDDDAKNSIGKSSALLAIDFAFGGNSLIDDKSGAIRNLGQHRYEFSFEFSGQRYYFSRSTDSPDVVDTCDVDFVKMAELGVEEFRQKLKTLYQLDECESSFRSLVGPFSRIWGKGGLDVDHPFLAVAKESAGVAIERLVDLFGFSATTAESKKALDGQKERRRLIKKAMDEKIIPGINKTQYRANLRDLGENAEKIEDLKRSFGGALSVYEAIFDSRLRDLYTRKEDFLSRKAELLGKIRRLEREIAGITPRLSANIALVEEFFPTVNVEKLAQVEAFHQKIGSIVKKQLRLELQVTQSEHLALTEEVHLVDAEIQEGLKEKGMPDDVFSSIFGLKEKVDRATVENEYYLKKTGLDEAIKASNEQLEKIYSSIFLEIEHAMNVRLKSFNRVVYGAKRNSSELRILSANAYLFSSPDDTGTGKSFAGLIGFDLGMLALTRLPYIIHDSVIYKNIEVAATKRILRILSSIKTKQVFLAFDEAKKFGAQTERLIRRFTVLKLSHDDLLYNKEWRIR